MSTGDARSLPWRPPQCADVGEPASLERVCITGPESTGKTVLAERLATWAGAEWSPEAARAYAGERHGVLDAWDVEPIARAQMRAEDSAAACVRGNGGRLLVLDTDLLSTIVYARQYYGSVPRWIERAERMRRADLYLLCDVDVPWVSDGVRDRPTDRVAMHELFRDALARRRARVVDIRGDWSARFTTACDAVTRWLA
jgi:NadR type nicotinamide-nucleotide adenylyltransferase